VRRAARVTLRAPECELLGDQASDLRVEATQARPRLPRPQVAPDVRPEPVEHLSAGVFTAAEDDLQQHPEGNLVHRRAQMQALPRRPLSDDLVRDPADIPGMLHHAFSAEERSHDPSEPVMCWTILQEDRAASHHVSIALVEMSALKGLGW